MANIALLGAAHIHTPNFVKKLRHQNVHNVITVWDHDAARAQQSADALSATVTTDLDSVYQDDRIDAVIICSETNRHKALVMPAVKHKKHLFVEKPLGFSRDDANDMANAIEDAGLIFQTGYFMRGQPVHQFLKAEVEKGHFGTITSVRHSNCHSGSLGGWFDTDWRWMADPTIAGTGAFGDLGTHSLDILLWMFGEVERVTADIKVITHRYDNCDETGDALLRFKNGITASLTAGWVSVADPIKMIISGTQGYAVVHGDTLYYQSNHVEGADGGAYHDLPDMQPHAFDLFLAALAGENVPLVSAREAAYRNTVMQALYEANTTHTWQTIE